MVNEILAIRWIKNKVIRKQRYEYKAVNPFFAALLRDIEKSLLDKYKPDWRNDSTGTSRNHTLLFDYIEKDPQNSMVKQYHKIIEYIDDPRFQKYGFNKFNLKELVDKEFIQVIRDENLTKLLE